MGTVRVCVGDALSGLVMAGDAGARSCAGGLEKGATGDGENGGKSSPLSYIAALAAPQAASSAATYPLVSRHFKRARVPGTGFILEDVARATSGPERVIESMRVNGEPLRDFLGRNGVELRNSVSFAGQAGPMFVPNSGKLAAKALRTLGFEGARGGAMILGFKPGASESVVKGITAHELGHVARHMGGKLRPRLYTGSKALSLLLGGIGMLRSSRNDVSGREAATWTAANALAAAPMLREELKASLIGSKMVGLRGLKRLAAFRGIPSYIAMAASPGIAYGARKLIDRIRRR